PRRITRIRTIPAPGTAPIRSRAWTRSRRSCGWRERPTSRPARGPARHGRATARNSAFSTRCSLPQDLLQRVERARVVRLPEPEGSLPPHVRVAMILHQIDEDGDALVVRQLRHGENRLLADARVL